MPKPIKKKPLSLTNCSIARAVDVLGDRWTLLVLRELFHGTERFGEFVEILGIARNLLVDRLQRLEDNGLVERFVLEGSPRHGYRLTAKGKGAFPVIAALMQWANDNEYSAGAVPVVMTQRATNSAVRVALVTGDGGNELGADDIRMDAGPGARKATVARLAQVERRRLE